MLIYIIKVKNFDSECIDTLCAYADEKSAIEHIDSYKELYKNDLKANIWYDSILLKSKFEIYTQY